MSKIGDSAPQNRAGSGRFEPGKSGNPGGRPKQALSVRDAARVYSDDALSTLVEVMKDKGAPPSARVSAANGVLDRAWGKPSQPLSGDEESPLEIVTRIILEAQPLNDDSED